MIKKPISQKVILGAVILHRHKVLLLQRSKNETTFPNIWELPGGKREPLEDALTTVTREVYEETGLHIKPLFPVHIFNYQIDKPNEIRDATEIDFLVKTTGKVEIKLSQEHQAFAWVGAKEIGKFEITNETRRSIKNGFEYSELTKK